MADAPLTIGGCPACGSRSCVAMQCSRVDAETLVDQLQRMVKHAAPQPPAAPLTPPDTASMYKALQDAYVVLCGYNANPAWRSFASEKAAQQIAGILHAQPDATTHKDAP